MYFYSSIYWLFYNYIPYDLYFCDFGGDFVEWLVSDEDATCAAGVIGLFVHYFCKHFKHSEIYIWNRNELSKNCHAVVFLRTSFKTCCNLQS